MPCVAAPGSAWPEGALLATMKAVLGSILVLAAFVTTCRAQCYILPMDASHDGSPDYCTEPGGITYPLDAQWRTKDCKTCSCSKSGIQCCNTVARPAKYDTVKCFAIFYKRNCSYSVVELRNPRRTCPVSAWVL